MVGELQCRLTWGTVFHGAETLRSTVTESGSLPSPIMILSGQANQNYSVTKKYERVNP